MPITDKNSLIPPSMKKVTAAMCTRTPHFTFDSSKRTKVFWQFAVTCHTFFRVKDPTLNNNTNNNAAGSFAGYGMGTSLSTRQSGISATPVYSEAGAGAGSSLSRFLFGSKNRRSLSLHSPRPGLERTMSTLMELRRRSRTLDRGFAR